MKPHSAAAYAAEVARHTIFRPITVELLESVLLEAFYAGHHDGTESTLEAVRELVKARR